MLLRVRRHVILSRRQYFPRFRANFSSTSQGGIMVFGEPVIFYCPPTATKDNKEELHMAADRGDAEVNALISGGLPDCTSIGRHPGQMALEVGATKGRFEVVETFLDTIPLAFQGELTLKIALEWHIPDELVRELLADERTRLSDGRTALHLAKDSQTVTRLIGCGASVKEVDGNGCTALHLAASKADVVRCLLRSGSDPTAQRQQRQSTVTLRRLRRGSKIIAGCQEDVFESGG
jgi:hypothetical protein